MSISLRSTAGLDPMPLVPPAGSNVTPRPAQYFWVLSTWAARFRKNGIQPMLPSDSAILSVGNFWNFPLNTHSSIAPAVRTEAHDMVASPAAAGEIRGSCED